MAIGFAIGGAVLGAATSFFGQKSANSSAKKQQRELEQNNKIVDKFNWAETERKYDHAVEGLEITKQNNENNLTYQEASMALDYGHRMSIRDYEHNQMERAYDKSLSQATKQMSFNELAEMNANSQQARANYETNVELLFDENNSLIDYFANTTGLDLKKSEALNQASLQESKAKLSYQSGRGSLGIKRRSARAQGQQEVQNSILEGMKAAGQVRAAGGQGRSAAKAIQGILAESGARQALIANKLMFDEEDIDLNLGMLKDQMILDQTMVLSARDSAMNSFNLETSTLDAKQSMDKLAFSETRGNIAARDIFVRNQIKQARLQADLNAEASIMLKPEIAPPLPVPYALPRPIYQDILKPEKPPATYTAAAATASPWLAGLGSLASSATSIAMPFIKD